MAAAIRGKVKAKQAAAREWRWHTYHMIAVQLDPKAAKKFRFEEFVGKPEGAPPARPQTPQEIEAAGMAWHRALNRAARK